MMRGLKSNPLISVIVPIYNTEQYLPRCLNSIINQEYRNLEIICVDDGSTDKSAEICDEYASKDDRIKVIHKKNEGVVSAKKTGLNLAGGDYVAFVDSDDWIESNMYKDLVCEMVDSDIVVSNVIRDYGNDSIVEYHKCAHGQYDKTRLKKEIYPFMIYSGQFFERGIEPHIINCIFKKEIINKNYMQIDNNIRVGEDPACLYPALLDADKVCFSPRFFYHYQMRNNSIMGINDGTELSRYKKLYSYLKRRFAQYNTQDLKLFRQLNYFMIFILLLKELKLFQNKTSDILFPFGNCKKTDRIVIYGAGRFGTELYRYMSKTCNYNIVFWTDRSGKEYLDDINDIEKVEYDYILVAVLLRDVVIQIIDDLTMRGIPSEKIITVDQKAVDAKLGFVEKILE